MPKPESRGAAVHPLGMASPGLHHAGIFTSGRALGLALDSVSPLHRVALECFFSHTTLFYKNKGRARFGRRLQFADSCSRFYYWDFCLTCVFGVIHLGLFDFNILHHEFQGPVWVVQNHQTFVDLWGPREKG